MPVRFGEVAFAFVFEKFVDRRQHHAAGKIRVDADIEIEFVVEKMNVAVAEHAEKFSVHLEIVGMRDAILDAERRHGIVRDAIAATGNNRG